MVRLFLEEEVKYQDWTMWINDNGEIMLSVQYFSGKKYMRPYIEWTVIPTIKRTENILYNRKNRLYTQIESVEEIGYKYLLIKYPLNSQIYLMKCEEVELCKSSPYMKGNIWDYFKRVAGERLDNARGTNNRTIAKSVISQFEQIVPYEGTALHAYLQGKLKEYEKTEGLIYPFGINQSQMEAVNKAFSSQFSIIEGPPGTGKTQTILNIIANIIVKRKICAVVSNNNSAVENIYDKLKKENLDFLIAKLGKIDNKEDFFNSINYSKPDKTIAEKVELGEINLIFNKLKEHLHSQNKLAKIISEIQEIVTEKEYLDQWNLEHPEIKADYIKKYNLDYIKTIDLMAYLMQMSERALTFRDRWELLLHYKIFKSKFLNNIEDRESFIFSLQVTYYDKLLEEKNREKKELECLLSSVNFNDELKKLQNRSFKYLYQFIIQNFPDNIPNFTSRNYRQRFSDFVKYFPIIGSSTYSLVSSIERGFLLDYVIIDEASQQDLVPGILCFGCAKNVIVVGDRKQLSHIAAPSSIDSPELAYDCVQNSLLDSVCMVFENKVFKTLLKEHYRCHPKIIQFCNKQFYDNELIPMTKDCGEEALSLVMTAPGNHMRDYKNQREIESVLKATEDMGLIDTLEVGESIGFIAPYNKQVNLAEKMMSETVIKNTIHKFQGRECDKIIFSTVLDKKVFSQKQINFVDNAELVNVAVSRAKNKFILVTGKDAFAKNNKYIAALMRYIQYYTPDKDVYDSPVISAFDLLYSEYDKSLERLEKRLLSKDSKFKSEQIMAAILRDVLTHAEFDILIFHKQIYLKQLVLYDSENFSEKELKYIKNRASCDFVLYYRIGKQPFGVIEVDGGYHDRKEQMERDKLKNSILKKAGIPLCRLRTTDSNIMERVTEFIRENISRVEE